MDFFEKNAKQIDFVFHLGARTDTAEKNLELLDILNLNYSKKIWEICTKHEIPLVYASSAATYGDGKMGYNDDHQILPSLQPLNPYGFSKHHFDLWVLEQENTPPFWAGLKFFNVYGANEYHKGKMASVIFHTFDQIQKTGKMGLFRSYHPDFPDGQQKRDFIYVKDLVGICLFFFEKKENVPSGIYNTGSGIARSFLNLAQHVFEVLEKKPQIEFIEMPNNLKNQYQYFTEAKMEKLREIGFTAPFHTLEEGIEDYVLYYLKNGQYF